MQVDIGPCADTEHLVWVIALLSFPSSTYARENSI